MCRRWCGWHRGRDVMLADPARGGDAEPEGSRQHRKVAPTSAIRRRARVVPEFRSCPIVRIFPFSPQCRAAGNSYVKIAISATRLTQRVPWFCVPLARGLPLSIAICRSICVGPLLIRREESRCFPWSIQGRKALLEVNQPTGNRCATRDSCFVATGLQLERTLRLSLTSAHVEELRLILMDVLFGSGQAIRGVDVVGHDEISLERRARDGTSGCRRFRRSTG